MSVAAVVAAAGLEGVFGQWPVAGQNLRNTRAANGVVYGGSLSGKMFLDCADRKIL